MSVWEILVPTVRSNGLTPIRTRFHRVWDAKVREVAGGMTILPPVQGQWVSATNTLHLERMIPVRIACTKEQIEAIAEMTAKYYEQQAVMFYCISSEVFIREYK